MQWQRLSCQKLTTHSVSQFTNLLSQFTKIKPNISLLCLRALIYWILIDCWVPIALSCCNTKQKINKPPTDLLNQTTSGEMDAGMERKRGWRWWWLQLLRQKHSWKEINTETCEALLVFPSVLLFQAPISNIGGKVKLFSATFRWWIEKLFCCFKLLSWEFINIESKTTDAIRMNTYYMNHSFILAASK